MSKHCCHRTGWSRCLHEWLRTGGGWCAQSLMSSAWTTSSTLVPVLTLEEVRTHFLISVPYTNEKKLNKMEPTHQKIYLTCDMSWGVNIPSICQPSSSHGLGVMLWRKRLSYLIMINKDVCRTALTTLCLLKITSFYI